MKIIKTINGKTPQIPADCYVAENATIVGDVQMGKECSVWFNAVIRGDVHYIKMGDKVNIQDGAIIHATYQKSPTTIGNNVSVGHNAIVHGCTIHDNVLIGMGSIIMDDCVVESNSIIAAGAVVTKNTRVESGSIYAGVPAKKVK
ncbi:gamma carbonic anhydrase family protein, partial [Tenacibaculum finnmarkense]